nr:uroporphyrinogen decarboxylase family protein [bacterium]
LEKLEKAFGIKGYGNVQKAFGLWREVFIAPQPPAGYAAPDFSRYFTDVPMPEGAFINNLGVLETPANYYHFTGYTSPLRHAASLEDMLDFSLPNEEGWDTAHMAGQAQAAHDRGQVVVGGVGHIFEDSWQIRDFETFFMDLIDAPEMAEYILDAVMRRNILRACAAARAGADQLDTGDDVATQRGMMFHPDLWRRFFKPRWARVYDAARRIKPDIQIFYHSDGDITPIIPDLIEIGVTILNPIQPECMDIAAVKRDFGRDVVLQGCIGTQSTMPFGTPAEVREAVLRTADIAGRDGGLIFAPTHVLEPDVPVDNFVAYCRACQEVCS